MVDPGLKGKVALVTGAQIGIGAATAKALAREGAKVFISYLRLGPEHSGVSEEEAKRATQPGRAFYAAMQAKSADDVLKSIRDIGGDAEAWEADLADPQHIPALFDRAEKAFGPVEILVNNAAHCEHPDTVLTSSAEKIDRHFSVNTRAVMLMMREFGNRHVKRGAQWGRIVNISTDGAYRFSGTVSYGASKFATESISRVAARELGPHGVTVNTVSPGLTQTGCYGLEQVEREVASLPIRRVGQPDDIANAIMFFASQQADWITGQLLYVGGGHVM